MYANYGYAATKLQRKQKGKNKKSNTLKFGNVVCWWGLQFRIYRYNNTPEPAVDARCACFSCFFYTHTLSACFQLESKKRKKKYKQHLLLFFLLFDEYLANIPHVV